MTLGVCHCVNGPPPNGVCGACGIAGYGVPRMQPRTQPDLNQQLARALRQPLDEGAIRRIVREELERALRPIRETLG